MKLNIAYILTPAILAASAATALAADIKTDGLSLHRNGNSLDVKTEIVLDDLRLKNNHQIYITPVISDDKGNATTLPAVLVNGRNMQIAIERNILKETTDRHPDVAYSVRRHNGKPQAVSYTASLPLLPWMIKPGAQISFPVDSCGCGVDLGSAPATGTPLNLNPAGEMKRVYITPSVTELPVAVHEGKARVQFEVDRTVLHDAPYRTRNGQLIDNRKELQIIDDSIRYSLTDPNVEIAAVDIVGYASPESPYLHNEELATGRSRALAEYVANRHHLPREAAHYDAVPENWGEFREIVATSNEISPEQRKDLLALIDAPAYGPKDYDEKEKTLKTDPRFAKLYRSLILPKWFPVLRATKFQIKTRLKPLADEKLAEVILQTPEKMSLNQMFRVARLYPEGSEEFNKTIQTALASYPDDPVANLNAAISVLNKEELTDADKALAAKYLAKAGTSPEAENARGILATYNGDFAAARAHFEKAAPLPEATRNLRLLD